MTNLEKYNLAYIESFNLKEINPEELCYKGIPAWDSVGHMSLIAAIEDSFDIEILPDDVMDINSYDKGKTILSENYNISF